MRVELSDLQIDLIAAKSVPLPKKQPKPKEPGKKEAKKDSHLVDRLFYSKLIKNIEFAIKNVAIRFVMSDKPVEGKLSCSLTCFQVIPGQLCCFD